MAKKLRQNYYFQPGIPLASNRNPIAYAKIVANKEFIKDEVEAYVNQQKLAGNAPYIGYVFSSAALQNDIDAIIEAAIYDLRYNGNASTRTKAASYWVGATPTISGTRVPETTYITYCRTIINNYILTNTVYPTLQSPVMTTQSINAGTTAEVGATAKITTGFTTITDTITNGLSSLPVLSPNVISSIELIGKVDLNDLLLITNVTDNEVLYSFGDPLRGASVTFTAANSVNFPNALTVDNGTTTIYLKYNTDTMATSDILQIFEESAEMIVRPYDFGTDAIERMRVARPQAMIDADFEYGLQPTKWQAIATQRGYPSTYEIPGTEKNVVSVTTDASVTSAGVGPSIITVTTQGAHGWSVGQPFTIKALSPSTLGFSRAEGSFIVNTVPTSSTFTYYAKAKVGTSNGQTVVTSTTLLREAGFYTGAGVGNPTYSVFSNGSSGSFSTILAAPLGATSLTFTGSVPPNGAPITASSTTSSAAYITVGTQITSSSGAGGTVSTNYVASDAALGSSSVTLSTVAGLNPGMAINNGTGTQTIITNIVGNTLSLSSALTTSLQGDVQTYTTVAYSEVLSTGVNARFNISRAAGSYSIAGISIPGSGYAVADTLKILGSDLGGVENDNETYNSVTLTEIISTGTSATFNVNKTAGVYDVVTINNAGTGYFKGDAINIPGTSLGGTSPTHDLSIIVTGVTNDSTGGAITTIGFGGTANGSGAYTAAFGTNTSTLASGLDININRNAGVYTVPTINNGGSNYFLGTRFLCTGTSLDGTSPTNDATIRIATTSVGAVTSVTITGTAVLGNDLILRVVTLSGSGIASAVVVSGLAVAGTANYSSRIPYATSNGSTGATINITRSAGLYTSSVTAGGSGYIIGQRYKVLGTQCEGLDVTNDVGLVVSGVSTGAVTTFSTTGTAIRGSQIPIYSTLALSAPTILASAATATASYASIATIQIDFASPHGFVPGMSLLSVVTSDAGSNNHNLASGPIIVNDIQSSTRIRYTARASGTILTLLNDSAVGAANIQGTIYVRPDAFFVHRPFDGGVQLGTGGPQHGGQAIRQSKKYIRYQSGKGAMYNTGALFAPSYQLRSVTASGTAVNSLITIVADDTDHGLQVGAEIRIEGVNTPGYDGHYLVSSIVDERTLTVIATNVLSNSTAELSADAKINLYRWKGAVVRSGPYDDQNGIFWQYDGQVFSVGRRSSTFQLGGSIAINANSNSITGTNTRFVDQLKAGDRVVIRGMTHVVSNITSQTSMSVTPDFRGVSNVAGGSICKVEDLIIPQSQWNLDKCDGTGPSGYVIDPTKMQMIGIQFSWYGAGFIDWMLRGPNGNYVFCHRLKGNNLNTEAYMRTGNAPVRYEVLNELPSTRLDGSINNSVTTITVEDVTNLPTSGTVYIDNELISYTGKNATANTLTGCVRGTTLTNFNAGATRSYSAGAAASHNDNAGVIYVTNTCSPAISHWGSAYLIDGEFDEDRGYIFNYAQTNLSATTTKQTAFLIRLAPSVSNAIIGDLGERELLNRAQLLLEGIEITSDSGSTGAIIVEGVLNPQNYPVDPASVSWTTLQGVAQGGQPSFAQIASGGSVSWKSGAGTTTSTATTTAALTASATIAYTTGNGSSTLYFTAASWNTTGIVVGSSITTASYNNAVITSIVDFGTYIQVQFNRSLPFTNSGTTIAFTFAGNASAGTSILYFTKATFDASAAVAGTTVADAKFPANTKIATISSTLTYGGVQYYRVTFTQNAVSAVTAGATVTFQFFQPAYALPGETVFSFIANSGESNSLSLGKLKELTTTTLGGRGTFPNGPDVLAINIYKASGTAVNTNILLRWGEAQA